MARRTMSTRAIEAQVHSALTCCDFDNWAICDTLCFALFDRTPHAWRKVATWRGRLGSG